MKFREYGTVKPITVCADSCLELDGKIEHFGKDYDIIDLQFSTCYDAKEEKIIFSALLLVKVK